MIRAGRGRHQAYTSGLCVTYGLLTRLGMQAADHQIPLSQAVAAIASEHGVHRSTARRRIDSLVDRGRMRWAAPDILAFARGVPLRLGAGEEAQRLEAKAGDEVWATCDVARRCSARERQRRCRERKRQLAAARGSGPQPPGVTLFGALTHKTGPKNVTNAGTYDPVTPITKDLVGACAPTQPNPRLDLAPPQPAQPVACHPGFVDMQERGQVFRGRPASPSPPPPMPPEALAEIEAELGREGERQQSEKHVFERLLINSPSTKEAHMAHYPKDWPAPQTRAQAEVMAQVRRMQRLAAQRQQGTALAMPEGEPPDDPTGGAPPGAASGASCRRPPASGPPPAPPKRPTLASMAAPRAKPLPTASPPRVDVLRAFLREVDPQDAWRLNLGTLLHLGAPAETYRRAMEYTREVHQKLAAHGGGLSNPGGYCYRTAKALAAQTALPSPGG